MHKLNETTGVIPHAGQPRLCLSVEEAARQLGLGRTSVFALIKSGDLASVAIGRRRVIPFVALEALLERLQSEQRSA